MREGEGGCKRGIGHSIGSLEYSLRPRARLSWKEGNRVLSSKRFLIIKIDIAVGRTRFRGKHISASGMYGSRKI